MELEKQVEILANELNQCRSIFEALGDGIRQHLITEMIRLKKYEGVRVGELATCAKLSRSAVSHHLKILKDARIINVKRIGTKNYYYFDSFDTIEQLIATLRHVQQIEKIIPKPAEEE